MENIRKIAVLGSAGSFHDRASDLFFGNTLSEKIYAVGFPKLVSLIEFEDAECGLAAIENSISGSLIANINLLKNSNLKIAGETFLKIDQNLITYPGQELAQIRKVKSHPVAIEQCLEYFSVFPHIELIPAGDTASCAKEISEKGLLGIATIGSKSIASKYGLTILAKNIQSQSHNITRFVLLEKNPVVEDFDKASIIFTAPHLKGSLATILSALAYYGINLSKIQSAPLYNKEWEYFFYADLLPESKAGYEKAMKDLKVLTRYLKVLGEYKQANKKQ